MPVPEDRKAGRSWTSALSTAEFAAIKAVGFDPVGQVFGASVFGVGMPGGTTCPTYGAMQRASPRQAHAEVSGSGSYSAFGPYVEALYEARSEAVRRMVAECAALGGHGVVGVSLTAGQFHGAGLQFTAIGTAIRARAGRPGTGLFTSDISGQDFAKLVIAGFIPASLVFGISIGVRHDDWLRRGLARRMLPNAEIIGYTELFNRTRQDARNQLLRNVGREHRQGVLVQHMELRTGEYECPAIMGNRDRWAEAVIVGTSIRRPGIKDRGQRRPKHAAKHPAPLRPTVAILSLDPQREPTIRAERRQSDDG
jgi:uncharacterized protein YbjQ (UPF0145 family)